MDWFIAGAVVAGVMFFTIVYVKAYMRIAYGKRPPDNLISFPDPGRTVCIQDKLFIIDQWRMTKEDDKGLRVEISMIDKPTWNSRYYRPTPKGLWLTVPNRDSDAVGE